MTARTKYLGRHWHPDPADRRRHFDAEQATHVVNGVVGICLPTCTEGWHGGKHAPPLTLPHIAAYWSMNPPQEMPGGAA